MEVADANAVQNKPRNVLVDVTWKSRNSMVDRFIPQLTSKCELNCNGDYSVDYLKKKFIDLFKTKDREFLFKHSLMEIGYSKNKMDKTFTEFLDESGNSCSFKKFCE